MAACSVLIVDDVADIREVLACALEAEGYRVLEAESGREALARATADPPEAIIMDLQMPDVDGFEATRRLKSDPRLAHIPVIAYTAVPSQLPSTELFSAVLAKPCPIDKVLHTLASYRAANRCRTREAPHRC